MEISVIVPVYNQINYLQSCLLSIMEQDFKDYEVIVVDDGSTDGSSLICDNYSFQYENIRVFHQKNAGVAMARNLGLKKALGNYIVFVDSDDEVERTYLKINLYVGQNENVK